MAGTDARWRLGAGAAVLLVLGAVAGGVAQRMVADAQPAAVLPTPVATATAELVVDVQGAVAEPGVYRLPQGSRVLDALARAGGTADGAAPGALNLARPLTDGEQLVVPTVEEQAEVAESGPEEGGLVSLNRADAAALETLPGVGAGGGAGGRPPPPPAPTATPHTPPDTPGPASPPAPGSDPRAPRRARPVHRHRAARRRRRHRPDDARATDAAREPVIGSAH